MTTVAGGRGTVLRFSGFELDSERAELRRSDGQTIKLRPKTLEILRLLASNAGHVLSKQELMEAAWPNVHVGEDSLFQCIREIRTALGDDKRQLVRVISGRGYLFQAEVTEVDVPAESEIAPVSQPEPAGSDRTTTSETRSEPAKRLFDFSRRSVAFASIVALAVLVSAAVAAWTFRPILAREPATIAVLPIADESNDPLVAQMAANVGGRLTDGLAKIESIRVLAPEAGTPKAAFVVKGELQKSEQAWTIRTRMTEAATGEVKWSASYSVDLADTDLQMQQSRLTAGVGHALALRINELLNADTPLTTKSKVAIEQATAHINQTTPERFYAAQAMLEKALAEEPDNVEVQVALAALLMRGVQMVWLSATEREAAEAKAETMLQQTLRAKPRHLPAHEAYCRFLNASNQFRASLVACARALSFDPWNGIALYHVGLAQIQTGRFEDALATFEQANRFDTPQVSRWTWLVGAGWANMTMGRAEDAVPWLLKSIAITSASGRTHMLLAAAYQQLGRSDEARAAMEKGLELRPGSTMRNVPPVGKHSSPVYLEASERIMRSMVAAGLPKG
jgi:DNA-binding winged helix-turn-helix (wHTH) protein/tetratricopeptide (TPR) repeat protein